MEQDKLSTLMQIIKTAGRDDDEFAAAILNLAADSIALDTIKGFTASAKAVPFVSEDEKKELSEEEKTGTLSFTKKELEAMPKSFQKAFICDNRIVKFRYYNGLFQARYRREGLNIEVSSKSFETMKEKFIRKLNECSGKNAPEAHREFDIKPYSHKGAKSGILFGDYSKEWLEIKERTTKPSTFKEYKRMLEKDLIPEFGHMHLVEISRQLIQRYLFSFVEAGKNRTADKLKLMLSCIFDMAEEDFNLSSPMKKIVLPYYESKKGSSLTKQEERTLVEYCLSKKDDVASALLILLYFGLRQSELASIAIVDGGFLECKTSKERMGRDFTTRRIPFTPVFKRVECFVDFEAAKSVNLYKLRSAFKRLFPEHHPHELRYTFITRCKECGVNPEVVMLWDGHSSDKDVRSSVVDRGYTDYSLEFFIAESKKVDYDL